MHPTQVNTQAVRFGRLGNLLSGRKNPIPLFWFRPWTHINFGDELGPLLIDHLSHRAVIWAPPTSTCLVGPGSLMDRIVAQSPRRRSREQRIIWGSGFMLEGGVAPVTQVKVTAVRGPRSAERLPAKYRRDLLALGDPGLLVSRLFPRLETGSTEIHERAPLLVPHFMDRKDPMVRELVRQWPGLNLADTLGEPLTLISSIKDSSLVISTGLHPLIIADAYGIPSIWIKASDRVKGGTFKFMDHSLSVGSTRTLVSMHELIRAGQSAIALASPPPAESTITKIQDELLRAYNRAVAYLESTGT